MTQHYVGTKVIQAYENEKDGKPGFAVQYPDGYTSWSPKEVFEEAYLPIGVIPAGTPDFVQRMIAERVQLNDRKNKLNDFYVEAKKNGGHPDLQGDELSDIDDQLERMVEYLQALDQRIQRHGFIFHDTGRVLTVQQAQVESYTRIKEIIVQIIAAAEKKGEPLDLAATQDIPKAIREKIFLEFDAGSVVECSFENAYWNVRVRGMLLFSRSVHEYKIRHLECYRSTVDKRIAQAIQSAYAEVTSIGNTANDVVFMNYLSTHFLKKVGDMGQVAIAGRRIDDYWKFIVDYTDDVLQGIFLCYNSVRYSAFRVEMLSLNSRQSRFEQALDSLRTLVPDSVREAILTKLDESICPVGDVLGPLPTLTITRRGAAIVYKDEALERLNQMIQAAVAKMQEAKA